MDDWSDVATFVIPTVRLELALQTPEEVLAWVETLPAADRAEVSPLWIERVRATTPGDPWALSYIVKERATGMVVGACAFKGPPDADGIVEVAYGIDEPVRRRGFATEATAALVKFAFDSGRVNLVRAHTKPDNQASARVLAKCGFRMVGEVIDAEDGLVGRWDHPRSP